ncbi:hypothetical protein KOW79_009067 [Hemibagrus wyckioides]|uniref:Ig-like domain-containing protein n=1 Tax=Hemibagrus wyckioides TaxID=337641 RepID=A0A9D3NQ25_9TELE|nr:vascular cell adhesion protein 1b [Hemibagrus wyckioides]KAG7327461.1 hypothetical protein KOW79_009067 [Hemibagrus wyckioides]
MASVLHFLLQLILCYTAVSSQTMELIPKKPLFRVGDRQELTCRVNQCSGTAKFSWGSVQDRPMYANPQSSTNKSTLVFKSVQEIIENTIVCKAQCEGQSRNMQAKVKIRVYSFPNDPVVSGFDSLVSRKENTLTCKVSDVYPAEYMTVEWLRGGKVVHTQEGEHGIKSIQSNYIFKPQLNDTGESIICRATLNLDDLPQEERTRETTVSMAVLPPPVLVSLQPDSSFIPLERGSSMNLFCKSSGCPDPHINWKNVRHQQNQSSIDSEESVNQLGPWTVDLEDNGTFICEVECDSVVKSKRTELKVFSFPSDPTIEISGPFLEGNVTNLTCTVHDIFPVDCFHIQWMYGERELQSIHGDFSDKLQNLSLTIPIKPKDSDQHKTFTCKVSLKIGDHLVQKTASTTLEVHYSPKHTTIDVRPQKQLNEGETVTISCQTDSAPEGQVTLSRVWNGEKTKLVSSNGTQTSFSISYTNVSHSGIYVCEAVNRYGNQTEEVQITVQAPPRNISVAVYPSNEVYEGETITVCCQLVSFPPSKIALRKLDNGKHIYSMDGTFLLVNLTANNSGMYQITATNALGFQNKNFTINVIRKENSSTDNPGSSVLNRIDLNNFIIPVIGVGVLATVISTLDCIRRSKRKGFYEMTEGIP